MTYNVFISDCDINGIPLGGTCPFCNQFIGKTNLHRHTRKCGKKHIGVHGTGEFRI